jgi:phosphate:Na+ symporter
VHRLHDRVVESIETSAAHLELIADMKRLNSLFCSAAYAALEGHAPASPGRERERDHGGARPAAPGSQA